MEDDFEGFESELRLLKDIFLLECIFANSVDNAIPCPPDHNVSVGGHCIRDTQLAPRPNPNNGFVVPQSGFNLKVDPLAIGNIHSRENDYAATI